MPTGLPSNRIDVAPCSSGAVDDIGMTDHPADVGSRPEGLAGLDAELVPHRPFERDHVAAIVAHDALGLAGRAGGVDDVERVGRGDRHAFDRPSGIAGSADMLGIVEVAAGLQIAGELLALQDQAFFRRVRGQRDRLVEQRLVGDDAAGLEAAGGRDHHFRPRVVDAGGEFPGGEAAEHDGMHGADAGAGEHGDRRLGDHRHVDDDAIALADAVVAEHGGERHHLVPELAIGEAPDPARDGAVMDQRDLLAAALLDMAVEAIVGRVAGRTAEPAAVDAGVGIEHLVPAPEPVDLLGRGGPEGLRVALPVLRRPRDIAMSWRCPPRATSCYRSRSLLANRAGAASI